MVSTIYQLRWIGTILVLVSLLGQDGTAHATADGRLGSKPADAEAQLADAPPSVPQVAAVVRDSTAGPDALAAESAVDAAESDVDAVASHTEDQRAAGASGRPGDERLMNTTTAGDGAAWDASYFLIMAKLGLGLGLVVLLVWGGVALLRRTGIGQQYGFTGTVLRVRERIYLSPRNQVCLIQVGDRALAIGVTDQQITALSEWGPGELDLPADVPADSRFGVQLRRLLNSRGAGVPKRGEAHP